MRAKQAKKRGKNKIQSEKFPHFFSQFGEEENKPYKTKTIYCIWMHIPYTIYGIRGWSWICKQGMKKDSVANLFMVQLSL